MVLWREVHILDTEEGKDMKPDTLLLIKIIFFISVRERPLIYDYIDFLVN